MEKSIQTQEVLTTGKAVYEKPTSQVYKFEVEGAILQASTGESTGTGESSSRGRTRMYDESNDSEW